MERSPGAVLRFKTRQLSLIVAIAETESLRQAADRIHLSQPAATRLLQELETAMGVVLFERSRQGMFATTAGAVMIDHARALLTAMKDAYVNTLEAASGKVGNLRLGVFGGSDPQRIASAVLHMREHYPGIRISIREAPLDMLLSALHGGQLDLVISRIRSTELTDMFRHETIYHERFVIVCGEKSSVHLKEKITFADIISPMWIVPPPDTLVRQHVDNFFATQFGSAPVNMIESASLLGNLALLRGSDSICIMAAHIAEFFKEESIFHVLPLEIGDFFRPVAMITLRTQLISPQVQQLMQLVRGPNQAG